MKKFFGEFKKFITRGNVVDMAVGVIVGSSFTAIVNGLSNNILKPLINYLLYIIMGKDSLSDIHTVLVPVMKTVENADGTVSEVIDLTQSIYIDWGAFINAIINFFLVAFVLFVIVKVINKVRERQNELADMLEKGKLKKEDRAELKARGIKLRCREAVCAYLEEKRARIEAEEKAKAEEAEEAARREREENPTAEDLLKKILAVLEKTEA